MGRSREEVEIRWLLKEHGEYVRDTLHGELWKLPGGKTITVYGVSRNTTDWRGYKNTLAELKRVLREAGIGGSSEPAETPDEEEFMDAARLAELGIHVEERSTKRVIRTMTREATVPLLSLAHMLQLAPVESPEGSDVHVVVTDEDDAVVFEGDSCLTIKFWSESVEES